MKISDWARQQHIHPGTAQRWFEAGNLPVPARRLPSGTILVEETTPQAGQVAKTNFTEGETSSTRATAWIRVSGSNQL